MINSPLETNGKLIAVCVPVLKHITCKPFAKRGNKFKCQVIFPGPLLGTDCYLAFQMHYWLLAIQNVGKIINFADVLNCQKVLITKPLMFH